MTHYRVHSRNTDVSLSLSTHLINDADSVHLSHPATPRACDAIVHPALNKPLKPLIFRSEVLSAVVEPQIVLAACTHTTARATALVEDYNLGVPVRELSSGGDPRHSSAYYRDAHGAFTRGHLLLSRAFAEVSPAG
jgi:hypothetical protein